MSFSNTIKICGFCGERSKLKCNYCTTKEKRRNMVLKQIEINKENAAKGFNIQALTFGGKTEAEILVEYEIESPVYPNAK